MFGAGAGRARACCTPIESHPSTYRTRAGSGVSGCSQIEGVHQMRFRFFFSFSLFVFVIRQAQQSSFRFLSQTTINTLRFYLSPPLFLQSFQTDNTKILSNFSSLFFKSVKSIKSIKKCGLRLSSFFVFFNRRRHFLFYFCNINFANRSSSLVFVSNESGNVVDGASGEPRGCPGEFREQREELPGESLLVP